MIPSAYSGNYVNYPSYGVAGQNSTSAFLQHRQDWQQRQLTNDPANEVFSKYLEATFNNNLPAYPLSNPFNQVSNYQSVVYLGIQALVNAMSGARVGLEQKVSPNNNGGNFGGVSGDDDNDNGGNGKGSGKSNKNGRNGNKGVANSGARPNDMGYVPIEQHPLLDVLRHPNDVDTPSQFLAKIIIQWHLTGRVLIWGVPNKVGAPGRLYVIPTALCTPAYGLGNSQYPKGAWRVQQYYPASGLMGVLPGPLAGNAGCIIDSREFYMMQNPHPLYNWCPTSPVQAGQIGIDLLQMIDQSCWSVMRNGVKPSGVFDMPGATKPQLDDARAAFEDNHTGPDNHGKIIFLGGGDPKRPAGQFSSLLPNADVMGFTTEWERYAGFTLACLGIDLSIVGLKTTGSFAELWASIQKVRVNKFEPFLASVADTLTQGVVRDWGLGKAGVRVILSLPEMANPELIDSRASLGAQTGLLTYNEIRASLGKESVDGGDYPTSIYIKLLEKQLGVDQVSESLQQAQGNAEIQLESQEKQMELESEMQQQQGGSTSDSDNKGSKSGGGPPKKKSKDKGKKKGKKKKSQSSSSGSNEVEKHHPKNKNGKGTQPPRGKQHKKSFDDGDDGFEYVVKATEEERNHAFDLSDEARAATAIATGDNLTTNTGENHHPMHRLARAARQHARNSDHGEALRLHNDLLDYHNIERSNHLARGNDNRARFHTYAIEDHQEAANAHERLLAAHQLSEKYPEATHLPLDIAGDYALDQGENDLHERIRDKEVKALVNTRELRALSEQGKANIAYHNRLRPLLKQVGVNASERARDATNKEGATWLTPEKQRANHAVQWSSEGNNEYARNQHYNAVEEHKASIHSGTVPEEREIHKNAIKAHSEARKVHELLDFSYGKNKGKDPASYIGRDTFNPSWVTESTVALARGIVNNPQHDPMSYHVLSDAIRDAGGEHEGIHESLRSGSEHAKWVPELILAHHNAKFTDAKKRGLKSLESSKSPLLIDQLSPTNTNVKALPLPNIVTPNTPVNPKVNRTVLCPKCSNATLVNLRGNNSCIKCGYKQEQGFSPQNNAANAYWDASNPRTTTQLINANDIYDNNNGNPGIPGNQSPPTVLRGSLAREALLSSVKALV